MRRKRFKKLPLQANYYPTTCDGLYDKVIYCNQCPLRRSSLASKQFEVKLDHKLNQDDNLRLGQRILGNKPTRHVFTVLLEKSLPSCEVVSTAENHPAGIPSISTYLTFQTLFNSLIKL